MKLSERVEGIVEDILLSDDIIENINVKVKDLSPEEQIQVYADILTDEWYLTTHYEFICNLLKKFAELNINIKA